MLEVVGGVARVVVGADGGGGRMGNGWGLLPSYLVLASVRERGGERGVYSFVLCVECLLRVMGNFWHI